jgi:hypothetical protein
MEAQTVEDQEGILLKCPNTTCNHRVWRYKGQMKVYAICPDCRGSVKIAKHRIQEE